MPDAEIGRWSQYSVLVVDDEPGMCNFLARALEGRGAAVAVAGSAEAGAAALDRHGADLIVLDIALPGKTGVAWLMELREQGFSGDVILMTAFADLDTAIAALRAGASDFILKPFRLPQMINAVQRCFERAQLARENFVLRRELSGRGATAVGLVGHSPAIRQLHAVLARLAPSPSTVLLLGESGTGKELAARALHELSGRSGAFVPVNCAAVAPELIESELFGHVKGAFTNASSGRDGLFLYARGGTLFLDEVGELPLALQVKLLRVLEERRIRPVGSERELSVDVRIVAATNRKLGDEVAAGRFRQDLYYRLHVVEICMPPLRERREDIGELFAHFGRSLAPRFGLRPPPADPETVARLAAYDWPGNVRELRNYVERSLILGELPPLPQGAGTVAPADAAAMPDDLAEVERRHVLKVLAASGGNKSEAARRLGVSRKTMERRCAEWNI
jgi:DNA-binding NtrC family response regulator